MFRTGGRDEAEDGGPEELAEVDAGEGIGVRVDVNGDDMRSEADGTEESQAIAD